MHSPNPGQPLVVYVTLPTGLRRTRMLYLDPEQIHPQHRPMRVLGYHKIDPVHTTEYMDLVFLSPRCITCSKSPLVAWSHRQPFTQCVHNELCAARAGVYAHNADYDYVIERDEPYLPTPPASPGGFET